MNEGKICTHLKHLNRETLRQVAAAQISKQCSHHLLPLYYLCLHCGQSLCLHFQADSSCLKSHRLANKGHFFAVEVDQGSIWCGECGDSIQNLIFSYSGSPNNEDYGKMKRFEAYLVEVWKQISPKMQSKPMAVVQRGLVNLGNTCYLNSVLQSLFATLPLRQLYSQLEIVGKEGIRLGRKLVAKEVEYFYDEVITKKQEEEWNVVSSKKERSAESRRIVPVVRNGRFNIMFKQFLQEMGEKGCSYNPKQILQFLGSIQPKYREKQEQDADELLLLLIDLLSQGQKLNLLRDIDRYKQVEKVIGYQKLTPLQNIFGYYLLNQTQCSQCKCISNSLNLSYSIPLSLQTASQKEDYLIHHSSSKIDVNYWEELHYPQQTAIDPLLEGFFRMERLNKANNFYECVKCKSLLAYRRYYVVSPPQVLVLTIKRFNSQLQKKNSYLGFPQKLNLKGVAVGQFVGEYKLYGVVVHEGRTLGSGHYVSYIKVEEQWVRCSDEKIQAVQWQEVKAQQAYMLFYSTP